MTVSDAQIEDVKLRTDIAELISSYGVNLRHAGSRWIACCPFHNEKTPSFSVDANKGFYKCFGCGESGDAIKFVQKMEGLSFMDALRKLADRAGVRLETRQDPEEGRRKRLYALVAELSAFYHRCLLKTKEAQIARDYLKSREIGDEVVESFNIGYALNDAGAIVKWGKKYGYTPEELELAGVLKLKREGVPDDRPYHRFSGRLMFTICDRQGRAVGFSGRQLVENKRSGKYVNSPETPVFRKSKVLFLFDRASRNIVRSPHREIIICEGQIDAIRLHVNGFNTAVAGQGTAFTDDHAQMIKRVADAALLMYDDDNAGRKAAIKVAGMLLKMEMPVRVVSLPGGDDPDSYLRHHAPSELQSLIDNAESIVSFQCRAERAKEPNPDSLDAVSRISKAVVATVAACPNPILRSTMAQEASKLLSVPVAALSEEIAKAREAAKSRPQARTAPEPEAPDEPDFADEGDFVAEDAEPVSGEEARDVEPPNGLETEFMAYLVASEADAKPALEALRVLLPEEVFGHDFTRRFVRNWIECASSEDGGAAFDYSALMSGGDAKFCSAVLYEGSRLLPDAEKTALEKYVRKLWSQYLMRRKLSLPANGGSESEDMQMKLALESCRIAELPWEEAMDFIEELKKEYT